MGDYLEFVVAQYFDGILVRGERILVNLLVIGLMLLMAMATAGKWLIFDLVTLTPLLKR
ncbi:MAG: hypothetical protein WD273_01080 [Trueperaceae bacterium]